MSNHQLSADEWDAVQNMRLDEAMRYPEPEHEPGRNGIIYRYLRCSHQSSADSGYGLDDQNDVTARYVDLLLAKDPTLVDHGEAFIDKAVSAYSVQFNRRPAGAQLFRKLRRGDHIVFARIDRGFRSVADLTTLVKLWNKTGVTVHFIEECIDLSSLYGPFVLVLLGAIAEMDSRYKSQRNKETAARQRRLDRPRNGKCKPGFQITGKKGQRRFIPRKVDDPFNPLRIGELVRKMHDEEGVMWDNIPEYVEQYRAIKAGRRPRFKFRWGIKRLRLAYETAVKVHNGEPVAPSDPEEYQA